MILNLSVLPLKVSFFCKNSTRSKLKFHIDFFKASDGELKKFHLPLELNEPYFKYQKKKIYDKVFEFECNLCKKLLRYNLENSKFKNFKTHLTSKKHMSVLKDHNLKLKSSKDLVGDENGEIEKTRYYLNYKTANDVLKECTVPEYLLRPYFEFNRKTINEKSMDISCKACNKKIKTKFDNYFNEFKGHCITHYHKENLVKYLKTNKIKDEIDQNLMSNGLILSKQATFMLCKNKDDNIREILKHPYLNESCIKYKKQKIYSNLLSLTCTLCKKKISINFGKGWTSLKKHFSCELHLKNLEAIVSTEKEEIELNEGDDDVFEDDSSNEHVNQSVNEDNHIEELSSFIRYRESDSKINTIKFNSLLNEPSFSYRKCDVYDKEIEIACNICYDKFYVDLSNGWNDLIKHLNSKSHANNSQSAIKEHEHSYDLRSQCKRVKRCSINDSTISSIQTTSSYIKNKSARNSLDINNNLDIYQFESGSSPGRQEEELSEHRDILPLQKPPNTTEIGEDSDTIRSILNDIITEIEIKNPSLNEQSEIIEQTENCIQEFDTICETNELNILDNRQIDEQDFDDFFRNSVENDSYNSPIPEDPILSPHLSPLKRKQIDFDVDANNNTIDTEITTNEKIQLEKDLQVLNEKITDLEAKNLRLNQDNQAKDQHVIELKAELSEKELYLKRLKAELDLIQEIENENQERNFSLLRENKRLKDFIFNRVNFSNNIQFLMETNEEISGEFNKENQPLQAAKRLKRL